MALAPKYCCLEMPVIHVMVLNMRVTWHAEIAERLCTALTWQFLGVCGRLWNLSLMYLRPAGAYICLKLQVTVTVIPKLDIHNIVG